MQTERRYGAGLGGVDSAEVWCTWQGALRLRVSSKEGCG